MDQDKQSDLKSLVALSTGRLERGLTHGYPRARRLRGVCNAEGGWSSGTKTARSW